MLWLLSRLRAADCHDCSPRRPPRSKPLAQFTQAVSTCCHFALSIAFPPAAWHIELRKDFQRSTPTTKTPTSFPADSHWYKVGSATWKKYPEIWTQTPLVNTRHHHSREAPLTFLLQTGFLL
ncbi:hypothetical protein Y1Q_0022699 [Alligator mississippiensis]|uniref:Uncharacterized protein n=1 Tax=Alligator mississippiensis TaxID=8496 RepID=A0A151MY55_ALLMI|nr:hypothetical protein Y1Q_0022699 [Alligator mississippiensis]